MTRVIKDPAERKNELIDMAEQLFIEKGYDNTLVSDIVKKLGVAQGTFYYYFKSKDEVLGAILERMWEQFASQIKNKLDQNKMDSIDMLRTVFAMLLKPETGNDERQFLKLLEDPGIVLRFHQQFDEARVRKLKPIFLQIVKEGIESGIFGDLKYPEEVTEIVFFGINTYMHVYSPHFTDSSVFFQKISALEELLEKVLGIKAGSLDLISNN